MLARLRNVFGSRPYLYGAMAGFAMFVAVYVVDDVMLRFHLRPEATLIDEALLGSLAAALVITLELQHEKEMRRQQERLAIVIQMNHHIRNALQAIVFVNSNMKDDDAAVVRDATRRIEWALREILPADKACTPGGAPCPQGGRADVSPQVPTQTRPGNSLP